MPDNNVNLTSRETEVLILIFKGLTNSEIAETLGISPNTTRTHRENLRRKFNVTNTASMINAAVKMKLLK